ncbi:preprotein translocase subunit YajC [Candidatus Liberibacter asiaticus]|uniref:Sec translocon accessory complex subunit YajC n=1 Tax=Candidatus Liberibacter asiaticus str. gxpsy TaxID=1174529 RepID=A0ABM5NH24_LIBAS|nr:preprotein translocase subunit YajC [Candidatus Liberibacter asiaticus]AGH17352.1 preprotein tranlocase protein [Candidatus Liberibacter asiaticus str. gxpsy]ALK07634.1 preprotein translocase subunit YajC [Candidatus Liberibacter asiaticus]ASK53126.1 preprotein translocase subunit YajC [Candidatus Liberibacter asiaticus]AWL14451.1 preprotein translocase subunit YajC [Candidatus Liberibacter asiaticus]KAE9509709.1 preprotein translocase subunit YajC [Candidatus Liberibacter asiaticus]
MIFTTVYAQSDAPAITSATSPLEMAGLFFVLAVVWYFLLIRPQRQQLQRRAEMLRNLRRGDSIVTAAGIVGKVVRVIDDLELEVEIAENVRVRVVRSFVSEVQSKSEPV